MGNQSGKLHHPQTGKVKKNVHWKSAEPPSPPGRPILIPLSDQQPDVITLKWERSKLDGGSPITGYIVEHRRMGSPHWVRATPIPVTRCEVSISGLEPGWRYQFRAIAENIVGKSEPSELSDPLTVTLQRNAISVPRFVNELTDTHAVEDERVEFRVTIMGQPAPEINWFKDGYEIFSSRRTKIVNDNDASVLIIHQVALTDEGEIKCTATNRAGHVVTKAKLTVEAPPKIRLPRNYEDGIIIGADEVLRMKIGIAGQPPPIVQWSHEGEIIQNRGRFTLETTEKNSLLRIENIKRSDRGEYMIKSTNKLGIDVASFLVTVTSRPNPPGKVQLNVSFGKSATLSWTPPDDDGGCKIGSYIVEYFRIGWNVWLKAATTRHLSTKLNDLIEGSEYKFRVKAENPYGVSDPSEDSDILFIPDPKRGINKPERKFSDEIDKPVPPRRKTLSPQRNINQEEKSSKEASPHPTSRQHSPNLTRTQRKPQVLDSEDLHRVMSYGTSNNLHNLAERRSPSKASTDTQTSFPTAPVRTVRHSPSPGMSIPVISVSPATSTLEPSGTNDEKSSVPEKKLPEKVVTFQIKPRLATPERSQSPEMISSTTQVNQNFGISQLKSAAFSPSIDEIISELPRKMSTSLQRSEEPVELHENQNVCSFSEEKTLPNKIETESNDRKWKDEISSQAVENPTIQISSPSSEAIPLSEAGKRDEVHTSNEFMLVLFHKNSKVKDKDKQDSFDLELEEALQPPPISISSPDIASLDYTNLHNFPLRRSVSSTELLYERAMARFYEAVEMEEAEKARKLKLSQEKLNAQLTAAATTTTTLRKRLGSMTEAERLSFEKRSEMRRRSADINNDSLRFAPTRWDSKNNLFIEQKKMQYSGISNSVLRQDSQETDEFSEDQMEKTHDYCKGDSFELGSDYTESTASSDDDSIEKFKMELMARTRSTSGDLETYHPRDMSAGVFTPYRSPTPEQSVIVLNRPVPLPSPDFVPKPILKRTSSENIVKEDEVIASTSESILQPNDVVQSSSKEKFDIGKGIKSFFTRREKKSSSTEKNLEESSKILKPEETLNPKLTRTSSEETKRRAKEEEERKRLEAEEEGKVAAKHYGDIVRQVGTTRQYTVPLYLNRDELKKAAEKATQEGIPDDVDEKELTFDDITRSHSPQPPRINTISPPIVKPKLSLSERQQVKHVKTTPSCLALTEDHSKIKQKPETPPPTPLSEDNYRNSRKEFSPSSDKPDEDRRNSREQFSPTWEDKKESRGRTKVMKMKKIIKKRVGSSTRSRDPSSSSRPPSSMNSTDTQIRSFEPEEMSTTTARRRLFSRNRSAKGESKSPGPLTRKSVASSSTQSVEQPAPSKTLEQLTEEAQEKVRSALSYSTDLVLFIVACYVYLFKDARLVLPILALMIYRQMGEAIKSAIPNWMKRKKNN